MSAEYLFRWVPEAANLVQVEPCAADMLMAADSWLVSAGRVRGYALHWERFIAACREAVGMPLDEIEDFRRRVTESLPREGQWFPRIELVALEDKSTLQFRLRPAPPLTKSICMMRWQHQDIRLFPRRKGPDLALLGRMRQQTMAQGADEALLTTEDGLALEGLTTNIVWWEGDTLCLPDPFLPLLPGVTSRLLVHIAHAMEVPLSYRRVHVDELRSRTVWTVNALHGIRPVVQWTDGAAAVASKVDHRPWQSRLCDLAVPLDDSAADAGFAREYAEPATF